MFFLIFRKETTVSCSRVSTCYLHLLELKFAFRAPKSSLASMKLISTTMPLERRFTQKTLNHLRNKFPRAIPIDDIVSELKLCFEGSWTGVLRAHAIWSLRVLCQSSWWSRAGACARGATETQRRQSVHSAVSMGLQLHRYHNKRIGISR